MEKWFLHTKRADFNEISKKHHIHPVIARIIRNRDVEGDEAIHRYLEGSLEDLYDPMLLKDMEKAVEILLNKINDHKKIRIIGDYDIDGVCSTYILFKALLRCGAQVDYEIPDRIQDGYGINQRIIQSAYEAGVDTLLTCDNGISAISQVQYAKELGLTVIVTDHHDVPANENGEILVPADAVINPKQSGCTYPLKGICGAVVAYKLVEALFMIQGLPKSNVYPFLEFAAIATIGDVMDLQDENRIIVKYGLSLVRKTKNNGLKALILANELNLNQVKTYHIGFIIGPCLNAGGRLDTAKRALELLLEENENKAAALARDLKSLNDKRKVMTQEGVEAALTYLEINHLENDKVLVIYLTDCHESLAGIIAGRIRERFEKPALVLTKGEEGVKGSGRSIEAYHMYRELSKCSDILHKFGGHPMAAGFSLDEKNIAKLRRRLNENAVLTEADFIKKIWIDVALPLEYLNEELIHELELIEPFGNGNSKPVFAQKEIGIRRCLVFGKNKNVIKLVLVSDRGFSIDGILFKDSGEFFSELEEKYGYDIEKKLISGSANEVKMNIIYHPAVNEYNGKRMLQVVIDNYMLSKSDSGG